MAGSAGGGGRDDGRNSDPRDGRPGQGGSSADGPQFDWLYGKRGSSTPPPEETRMMPVQPRPGGQRPTSQRPTSQRPAPRPPERMPAADVPPSALAPTPGTEPPRRPPGGRRPLAGRGPLWQRPRFWRRLVVGLLALWLVFTVVVPFWTWSQVDKVAFEPRGQRPAEQDGTTYLLVGSDSRANLTAAQRRELATGNPTSELTDTIMLLHTGSGPNVLLSLPRDTLVNIPGYGTGKINSAFARGGARLLTRVVERETGIRVDQYVSIGLGGVAGVVDAVGGIQICPRERMVDPLAGLKVRKGCQEADGATALGYSRSRKISALGDLDRVRRQREVVAAIGDKVLSPWSVVNPIRWYRLNAAVPDFFGFGKTTSTLDAAKWALAMSRTTGDAGRTCTVPVTDTSATVWDDSRAQPLFDAIIDDDTDAITADECTPSGLQGAT